MAKEINSSKLNIPDDMTISFSSKEVMAKPYKEQRYKRKKEKILILGNGISMMGKIIHLVNFAYAREIARSNKIMALAMEIVSLPDRERALIDIEIDKIIEYNASKKCHYARNVIQFKTVNCNQSRDDDTLRQQKASH